MSEFNLQEEMDKVLQELENSSEDDFGHLLQKCGYTPKPKLRCVGRLSHNRYMHGDRLVSQSTFTLLKRKSQLSLSDMVGDADIDIDNLELFRHAEGLYEIVICNESRDWETGMVDDWELKLVPYVDDEGINQNESKLL